MLPKVNRHSSGVKNNLSSVCGNQQKKIALSNYYATASDPENIIKLKEAFLNQKRTIRNNLNLNFEAITDLIPSHYKHVNNEMNFVCQMVDALQDIEFLSAFPGPNLNSIYPITANARYSIVNWLSKFHLEFQTKHSTFLLSIAIFDQYIIRKGVMDQTSIFKLAVTSTLIAFKMEEIMIPSIYIMLKAVKSKLHKLEIINFEIEILKVLDFEVNIYTAGVFLKIFVLIGEIPNYKDVYEMANLFIDIALTNINLAGYPYCFLAAATLCVSNFIVNENPLNSSIWNKHSIFLTGIKWSDIVDMCMDLCDNLKSVATEVLAGEENVMINKYSSGKNISAIFIDQAQKLFNL